ncbi:FYN-binding protein 1 isoform X2 [Nelusetta ayraudi]|uniref:FYN-binding protein 1 isoform X2 n=1 Tax=Nelusetta ayraudi TaxID=303726 RepID=UPI003F71F1CB
MEESFDVKALRARFNNHAVALDSSSRDSSSPKSPRPAFGKSVLPQVTDSDLAHLRLSPTVPSPPMASPGPGRLPRPDPPAPSFAAKGAPPQWTPPPQPGARPGIPLPGVSKVKQMVDAQQNRSKQQQRAPVPMLVPGPLQASVRASASSAPLQLRRQPQQRPPADVTPLRRPLPPEGPLPLKPNRPPRVNIEPFLRFRHKPAPQEPTKTDGSSVSERRKSSLVSVSSPPQPPQRFNKPRLPRQVASIDIDNDQETYDDIASFEKSDSWSDGSQGLNGDNEVYEAIDEDQVEANLLKAEKIYSKGANSQQPPKINLMEQQKHKNELRKKFQLEGQAEVLHVARVRHSWSGEGPLDMDVRQDDRVDIIRVKNNPGGKWLARSVSGNYGYISNTCVDIDYEAVKRSLLKSQKKDISSLPPPPPDPPQLNADLNRDSSVLSSDDYDDVEPLPGDFPPPPSEIRSQDSQGAQKEIQV